MTEPADTRLDEVRRHLSRRGYLRAGLPPTPPPLARRLGWLAVIACALAALLSLSVVSAWHVPVSAAVTLALAFLPFSTLVCAAGVIVAPPAGRTALRLGARPRVIAAVFAVVAGGAVLFAAAAVRSGAPGALSVSGLAVWGAAIGLSVEVARRARRSVVRQIALGDASEPVSGRWSWLPLAAVVAGGIVLIAVAPHQRRVVEGTSGPTSFPRPQGRVAVIAVDGLAREDVAALAQQGNTWEEIAGWGWAPLEPIRWRLPAVAWTTVACGTTPADHGVTVLDEVRLFGARDGVALEGLGRVAILVPWRPLGLAQVVARPALNRLRPTFWEMASRAGTPVTVGGWWGSWPVRRVLGEVVSERAWLGGGAGPDAVTPGLAPLVREIWGRSTDAAQASDELARKLAEIAGGAVGPHLCALEVPSLDLVRRLDPTLPALAFAERAKPHLETIEEVVDRLRRSGYEVWVIAIPWRAGTPFACCSGAAPGEHPVVPLTAFASSIMEQLSLPAPAGSPAARRDLSGVSGRDELRAVYEVPPALTAPPRGALEVQRDVLRNLGYLQ